MGLALGSEHLDKIEQILRADLLDPGVHCILLLDLAGNLVVELDNGKRKFDAYSLAALAAGHFGAVSTMARMVGEEDIFLVFYKGRKENIYFSRIVEEFLLVTIFGNDLSLGFVRLKVAGAALKIASVLAS